MNNSEEQDTHRLNAENRMRILREANLRMFQENSGSDDSEEDDEEKEREEKKNPSDFSLGKLCNNETDLSLETRFDSIENKNIITILKQQTSKDYIHECYTLEEINSLVDPINQVYIWYKGSIKYAPIYKLPFSGIWIDTLSMIMLKKFNTFIIESLGKFKIGSYLEESQLHGAIEEIYCLRPIHQKTIEEMSSTPWVAEETDVISSENVGWRYKEKEKTRILLCPENEFCQVGIAYTLVCEFEEENITSFTCTRYIGQISEENGFIGVGCINAIQEKPYYETVQFSLDDEKGKLQGIKIHRLYINNTENLSYNKLEKQFTRDYTLDIKNIDKKIIITLTNSNFYTKLQIGEIKGDILEYKITGQCSKEHRWEIEYKPDQTVNNIIVNGKYKNGLSEGWYENGKQKYKHNYKDGELNGLSESWHENGQQKSKENYKDGNLDGLQEAWYENEQQQYKNNYKDGKLDGISEGWYKNGQQESKKNYKDGNLDGLQEAWYENEQQQYKNNYKDGKLDGISEGWYKNGQQQYKNNWKDGQRDGLSEGWYKNGQQQYKTNYKNGEQDGLQEAWYENGQQEYKKNYKNGEQDGLQEAWYENRQQQYKNNYKDGELDGLNEEWYKNGQQQYKFNYKDGKKDGLCESWYDNGEREYKKFYTKGRMIRKLTLS